MHVFVTGATGFIGGSVAVRLVEAGHTVSGLTRDEGRAGKLTALGIEPVFGTLDDSGLLAARARAADAVVNAADSDHRGAVEALISGLAGSGKPFLHTSGSSVVGDDARGEVSEAVFTEEIHDPGSGWRPEADKAPRVEIDRLVLAAADSGIRSTVLCNTLIYGHGLGPGRDSVQIPALVRQARSSGVARHVGPGRNIWSNVHIADVADLYALALDRSPAGSFHFVENGEESFAAITTAIAETLGVAGPEPWDIESAIDAWGYEPAVYALGSNSRVRATRPRPVLGWTPTHASVTDWIRGELTA
ncbi:NAD-dependent epimerase/dehydratase family protein [Streptomyces litchfieldiae]|uniref:NAD-dependent epimerase/dehydratase family protein n=1 Tax=Streptomyces litchfieldiae TaxID=3075543 RepID=A0ABU2N001_9ACTN|nr:NAD-dependent epimerase/dehydratase family protein [Streptomyces sp. DSM 44938]MDT0347223.1 NAD-dependent epimerase/dehydratase family protein [Streptomyces sp. DSM 44938]